MKSLSAIFKLGLFVGLLLQTPAIGAAMEPVILILGDSLSAGYGLEQVDQGWVAQLQNRLIDKGYAYHVINASISGETTRGALTRLDSLLDRYQPKIVVVELGGNDGLRGISLTEMAQNFSQIIEQSQGNNAKVLLVRMYLPPNYGPRYTEQFQQLFVDLAHQYQITTAAFILRGIATRPELMQPDGLHPRAEAQSLMLDNIWPALKACMATEQPSSRPVK
nr:arylesterase [Candidatus Nitrosoglobus terrae]